MLFDYYLNSCPDGGCLDMEVALCHVYSTLTHHHTKPGFNNLIPLLQVSCNYITDCLAANIAVGGHLYMPTVLIHMTGIEI